MSILEYLEETRPQNPLIPKNPVQKARVREICAVIVSGIQPLQNFGLRNYVGKENWVKWAQLWINKGFTGVYNSENIFLIDTLETSYKKNF